MTMNNASYSSQKIAWVTVLTLLAAIGVMFVSAFVPATLARERGEAALSRELPPEYHQCREALWSNPAATLSEYAAKIGGTEAATDEFSELFQGLRCSSEQIHAYAEHHGFRWFLRRQMVNLRKSSFGRYNREIHFRIPRDEVADRTLSGNCVCSIQFFLVDDEISFVILNLWGAGKNTSDESASGE